MEVEEKFFIPCNNWMGGYYLPVRNRWNFHTELKHVSSEARKQYEQEFGHEILYEDQFETWYIKNFKS